MSRSLSALLAVVALTGLGLATGAGLASGSATTAAVKKPKPVQCKKGYVRKVKRVRGRSVVTCVKLVPKFTPHPGLDIPNTPGTYKGSKGVTVTVTKVSETEMHISVSVAFPTPYTNCRPANGPSKVPVTGSVKGAFFEHGDFSGFNQTGQYTQIKGHFTSGYQLTLTEASAQNVKVGTQTCSAQYGGDVHVVF